MGIFTKARVFFGMFLVLTVLNTSFSHWIGRGVMKTAAERRRVEISGGDPKAVHADPATERAGLLVLTNLPLFIGMGFIVRSTAPRVGPIYWLLTVLGSTYMPFILTLLGFFLVYAPGQIRGGYPGIDADDGSDPLEYDDDGTDFRTRK